MLCSFAFYLGRTLHLSTRVTERYLSRVADVTMLLFTPWFWLSAGGFLAVAYIVKCLSSPLRKLPGPTYSIFTSVVLKWHEFHTNRTRYIHRLHQKYGPVVRIGPNEAAFASQTAVKEIYGSGGSGYDKTEFYDLFKVYGRRYGARSSRIAMSRMLSRSGLCSRR